MQNAKKSTRYKFCILHHFRICFFCLFVLFSGFARVVVFSYPVRWQFITNRIEKKKKCCCCCTRNIWQALVWCTDVSSPTRYRGSANLPPRPLVTTSNKRLVLLLLGWCLWCLWWLCWCWFLVLLSFFHVAGGTWCCYICTGMI